MEFETNLLQDDGVYCNDRYAFHHFFNAPPVLSPFELDFDLPAEEAGVDISDSLAWEEWASNERKHQRPPPLNQLMQELLADNWTGIDDPRFQNLNIFTLFIIISSKGEHLF